MRVLLALALLPAAAAAQTPLASQIAAIAARSMAQVHVACSLPGVALDCDFDPHGHPPMQSVFKLPLAVVVLQQIEAGKLQLDQTIRFLPSDRYTGTYSPLQDAHPDANVDVPVRELLRLSASLSDNIATDILLRLMGGPGAVQARLDRLGYSSIHVRDSEAAMHDKEQLQYRNDAEPAAMVALLRRLSERSPLKPNHTAMLMQWLTESPTGPKRIKGLLPAGTVVAHKTGWSGMEKSGLTPATNDVGLITLPDGRRLALAVFVSDSHANDAANDHTIAAIARAVYDEAVRRTR